QRRSEVVEPGPVSDRLQNPERDADRVGEEGSDKAVVDRDGKPVRDNTDHRLVVSERRAQVEPHGVVEPAPVGDRQGLVEAVVLTKLGELLFRYVQLDAGATTSGDLAAGAS